GRGAIYGTAHHSALSGAAAASPLRALWLGAVLLVALLIGGSSVAGLATTFILQLLCLPLLVLLAGRRGEAFYRPEVLALLSGIGLVFLFQLLPLGFLRAAPEGGALLELPSAFSLS